MLCHATLRYAMLCDAMLCHAMQDNAAMLCGMLGSLYASPVGVQAT